MPQVGGVSDTIPMIGVALQGALLGLATGLFCLSYCAPVFVPFMMSEKRAVAQSAWVIGELALGRLVGYLMVGAAIGHLGAQTDGPFFQKLVGGTMVALSTTLLLYVATKGWPRLAFCRWTTGRWVRFPLALGFLTGINICPPFLLAISQALALASMAKSILLFGGFFLGTSVYLILLFPLGYLGRWPSSRAIALMTGLLTGVFFFVLGVARLIAF